EVQLQGRSEGALALQPISGFVDQCCLLARNARTAAVEVYLAYVVWCLDGGIPVQDQFTFLDMLECYGLKLRQRKQQVWIRGIAVLPAFRVSPPCPRRSGTHRASATIAAETASAIVCSPATR